RRWPQTPVALPAAAGSTRAKATALILAYGLAGAGMVPHMVYFVDYAVRGQGLNAGAASLTWLVFGIGAVLGTLTGGRIADRWGGSTALKTWLLLQIGALVLALPPSPVSLWGSALLGGFAGIGITAVALARARELAGAGAGVVWVRATALYALAQAAAGFAVVPLFAHTNSYLFVFAVGLAVSVMALLVSTLGQYDYSRSSDGRSAPAQGQDPHTLTAEPLTPPPLFS